MPAGSPPTRAPACARNAGILLRGAPRLRSFKQFRKADQRFRIGGNHASMARLVDVWWTLLLQSCPSHRLLPRSHVMRRLCPRPRHSAAAQRLGSTSGRRQFAGCHAGLQCSRHASRRSCLVLALAKIMESTHPFNASSVVMLYSLGCPVFMKTPSGASVVGFADPSLDEAISQRVGSPRPRCIHSNRSRQFWRGSLHKQRILDAS